MLFPAFVKWLGCLWLDDVFSQVSQLLQKRELWHFCQSLCPRHGHYHDVGSLGSDGSVESKMAVAIYEGIWKSVLVRWWIASWKPETWADTSPPGLSCLVSHLNHSMSEPDPVWEYLVSRSIQASFKVVALAILITNSDLTDLLRITLASQSFLSHISLPSCSPVSGQVSMLDTTPHILQYLKPDFIQICQG